MPIVPLGLKSYRRDDALQPEVRLVNLILEKDESGASPDEVMRISRPGLSPAFNINGPMRALYREEGVFGGAWFAVTGKHLVRLEGSAPVVLAAVTGDDPVQLAGVQSALYVLRTGLLCRYVEGVGLVEIVVPEGHVPIGIETINGYLIVACSSGRFYWIEPGATTIDALNFATAESSPDGLVGVTRLVDELFFGGAASIEPWQPSGDADAPFQKAGGRQFERGLLARDTMRRFDNSLLWVGEDCIVYRVGSVPERISDHGIEERLRKRVSVPSAWTFGVDGHKFYVLVIPGQGVFAYDASSQAWSEFTDPNGAAWRGLVGQSSTDRTLAGGVDGKLYRVAPENVGDDGIGFPQIVTGSVPNVGKPARVGSLALGIGASAACTVKVRWRDGREPYPDYFEELPTNGDEIVNLYRLGALKQPSRTFEVRVDDRVKLRLSGARANEAWD